MKISQPRSRGNRFLVESQGAESWSDRSPFDMERRSSTTSFSEMLESLLQATDWERPELQNGEEEPKKGIALLQFRWERIGRRDRGRDASITFYCGSQIVDAVPVRDAGISFAGDWLREGSAAKWRRWTQIGFLALLQCRLGEGKEDETFLFLQAFFKSLETSRRDSQPGQHTGCKTENLL